MTPQAKKPAKASKTKKKLGVIISIVGGPRVGKSSLARLLAAHYGAELFLEGEENDFPSRIREDMEKTMRPLERILWFRNHFFKQQWKAMKHSEDGKMVVMDLFWLAAKLFVDASKPDAFENELVHDMFTLDEALLGLPDIIIHLTASPELIRKFVEKGGRKFDQSDEYFTDSILPVNKKWEDYALKNAADLGQRFLTVDRTELDFTDKQHFKALVKEIDSRLKASAL